ncbi:MAG: twin-arginine translocation signal domain-containing protein, partial [Verrucomicrobia bacterium]|nr:twin-arginine translocation signal domain-containing protein [Verrucomicrobiota bacterium]
MNAKEYQELLKSLSRRNFLRTGTATVAATLLAQGATVRAQERSNTEKADQDHSASDPAQENKELLAL